MNTEHAFERAWDALMSLYAIEEAAYFASFKSLARAVYLMGVGHGASTPEPSEPLH